MASVQSFSANSNLRERREYVSYLRCVDGYGVGNAVSSS